ncbi:hypothetical protein ABIA33_004277 [Streptacidiphilus sp. MAP12-16]|uniref:hypothetical protein n=1 Tax=Streptacidiphilus sp. MAP12-16 TaxID=3156300 RepID=UPI0035128A9F
MAARTPGALRAESGRPLPVSADRPRRPLQNPATELPSKAEADQVILGQVVAGWLRADGSAARGVFATAVP